MGRKVPIPFSDLRVPERTRRDSDSISILEVKIYLVSGRYFIERSFGIRKHLFNNSALERSHIRPTKLLGEDLQTVAIGIEEVHALGKNVVEVHLHVDSMALQPLVELFELVLATFDLKGRSAAGRTRCRSTGGQGLWRRRGRMRAAAGR